MVFGIAGVGRQRGMGLALGLITFLLGLVNDCDRAPVGRWLILLKRGDDFFIPRVVAVELY